MLRKLCCFLFVALFLSACGPMYETTYTYVPPKDTKGQMCVMQCQNSKSLCQRLCDSETENCKNRQMNEARFKYESYVSQQRAAGQQPTRDMNSFYDSYGCHHKCHCGEDYRSCFALCGGQVIPQTTCVAFCGQ